MWTSQTMTLGEAIIYSVTALAIVFLALVSIALFVKIISAAVNAVVKEEEKKPQAPAAKPQAQAAGQGKDVATVAAIVAAVSAETKDNYRIVSIEEKK